jgi:hypothetical protein
MKKLRSVSAGLLGVGILLAPLAFASKASATYYERTPGSFACRNSLDPQCKNPARETGETKKGSWSCRNNPGPTCTEPPRISSDLKKGTWGCRNNQNTPTCANPLRFSIPTSDHENWPTYFTNPAATPAR